MSELERVRIFDTTLRDGALTPGVAMTLAERLSIAEALQRMGVDVIEAGLAGASADETTALRETAALLQEAVVCALARAATRDIDQAAEALSGARRRRVHTYLATSPVHMAHKLQMTPDEVLGLIGDSVAHARNLFDDVEWSPEDATRSEPDFLCRAVECAIGAGAATITVSDTVGYAMPDEFAALIAMLRDRVPNIDKAVLSVHCHDDLGLAVANSLAAIGAGARQVQCTVNGLGPRAGNASLEEIVMAIHARADVMKVDTGLRTEHIAGVSRLVAAASGLAVPANKSIVGANVFSDVTAIAEDGDQIGTLYQVLTPQSVGFGDS